MFHESNSVFVLKEVEKAGAARGIVLQTVKDVLQTLADDDLVHAEKIGISNYYWAFAAEASTKAQQEVAKLEAEVAKQETKKQRLEQQLGEQRSAKQETENMVQKKEQLRALEEEFAANEAIIQESAENDLETHNLLLEGLDIAKEAANRWTDNCFQMQSYLKKMMQGREDDIDKFFKNEGFDEEWDFF